MTRSASVLALGILTLWTATPLLAQGRPFGETVEVELVLVDALVTDRAGRPVLDLRPDEFRLTEDGEPVAISQFSGPRADAEAVPEPAEAGEPLAGPSLPPTPRAEAERFVIFLDQLHLKPTSRIRSLQQLVAVLDTHLSEQTEVMVASFDGTVQVVLPPTRDRKRLLQALEPQARYGSQALLVGLEDRQVLHGLRQMLEVEIEMANRRGPFCDLEQACGPVGGALRSYADGVYGRVEATAAALREFLASLAAYPGRKVLLHVSDGFPLVAGQAAYEAVISWCDGTALLQGTELPGSLLEDCDPARVFPMTARGEIQSFSTAELWTRVVAEANSYRVTLSTLQASGLEAPRAADVDGARASPTVDFARRMNDQDPLFFMADETGGRAIFNANDAGRDLERMLGDDEVRYELAFTPIHPADGRVHRLRLEVTRPGLTVQHRKSYQGKTQQDRTVDRVLASLYHGAEDNRHRLRLETVTPASFGREVPVSVELHIPFRSLTLLPEGEASKGLLTVFVGARDERGATLPVGKRVLPLTVAAADLAEEFLYAVELLLPRGHDWEIAVALRDELANETSYLTTRVRLPEG